MAKNISIFLFLFFGSLSLFSQYNYFRNDSIVFKDSNNSPYKNPMVGGFNAPQFNQIDLNFDGHMDLVIFDRSGHKISTFLNDGIQDSISYTYAPQYQPLIPEAENFILSRDYNCDGKMDLFIGKNGIVVYENISSNNNLKFKKKTKIKSDYSNPNDTNKNILSLRPFPSDMIGIADVDGDGDLDIIEPYFIGRQMLAYHKNLSMENDSVCGLEFELRSKCWGNFTESNINATVYLDSCRWGDFPNAELQDKNRNRQSHHHFNKHSKHGNAGIALYDLDDNGSMDMILGDDGSNSLIALFNDDSLAPHNNSHIHDYDTLYPSYDKSVDLRVFPVAYFMDVNNDGIDDMIAATNIIDVMSLSYTRHNIHLYLGTGNKHQPFTYETNSFLDEEILDFGRGSFPAFFDYDGDGLQDLVIGNGGYLDSTPNTNRLIGQLALFRNTGSTTNPEFTLVDENFADIPSYNLNGSPTTARITPAFYDLTGDGKEEMIIGDVKGRLHYFKDTSAANQDAAFKLEEAQMQGINVYTNATPSIIDINGNNLGDLILANKSQRLQLNLNLGDSTTPIFNLEVSAIKWQSGNTVRYQLKGNPDLSLLKVGQSVDVNQSINGDNDVIQNILAINNSQKYLDLEHPFRTDGSDDEVNSTAVIDYSIKDFGQIRMGSNTHPTPIAYEHSNDLYIVFGSFNGKFYLYDSIRNNLEGKFRLRSSDYLDENFGSHTSIAATDLNADGKIDLVVGNEAGGINILYARNPLGLNDWNSSTNKTQKLFKIYPNPNKGQFTISLNQYKTRTKVEIFDISGRLVFKSNLTARKSRINQRLKNGLYFIRVSNKDFSATEKLIIK